MGKWVQCNFFALRASRLMKILHWPHLFLRASARDFDAGQERPAGRGLISSNGRFKRLLFHQPPQGDVSPIMAHRVM